MNEFPLPVRMVGPGSQPDDADELEYLPMPREMNTFRMPRCPSTPTRSRCARARPPAGGLLDELTRWDPADDCEWPAMRPRRRVVHGDADDPQSDAGRRRGQHRRRRRVTTFASRKACSPGCGASSRFDAEGRIVRRLARGCRVASHRPRRSRAAQARADLRDAVASAEGVMNAPALLAEIRAPEARSASQVRRRT